MATGSREEIERTARERVAHARTLRPRDRMFAGATLYRTGLEWMRRGVRRRNPDKTPEEIRVMVRDLLDRERDSGTESPRG